METKTTAPTLDQLRHRWNAAAMAYEDDPSPANLQKREHASEEYKRRLRLVAQETAQGASEDASDPKPEGKTYDVQTYMDAEREADRLHLVTGQQHSVVCDPHASLYRVVETRLVTESGVTNYVSRLPRARPTAEQAVERVVEVVQEWAFGDVRSDLAMQKISRILRQHSGEEE